MKTLNDVITAVRGQVDEQKLLRLRAKLEAATCSRLDRIEVRDPIRIRLQLVKHLRSEGASRGIVQAYEQLFMGIIRRAAILGLVEAPTEGPWSSDWQKVLDKVPSGRGGRSFLRSLAGWATARGIEPDFLSEGLLEQWAGTFSKVPRDIISSVRPYLAGQPQVDVESSARRRDRLAMKASVGSVRDLSEVYGVDHRVRGEWKD